MKINLNYFLPTTIYMFCFLLALNLLPTADSLPELIVFAMSLVAFMFNYFEGVEYLFGVNKS